MSQPSDWKQIFAACQPAVAAIRAAILADGGVTDSTQAQINDVIVKVHGYVLQNTRNLGADWQREALTMFITQFNRDVRSPSFPSMASQFGSYVKSTVHRIRFTKIPNIRQADVLYTSVSMDEPFDEDELTRHETIGDPGLEQLAEQYREDHLRERLHAAVERLQEPERRVIKMYLEGYKGFEIARAFDKAPARISEIHQRGVARLRRLLAEEG